MDKIRSFKPIIDSKKVAKIIFQRLISYLAGSSSRADEEERIGAEAVESSNSKVSG